MFVWVEGYASIHCSRCAEIFSRHLNIIIDSGLTPIVVFDGLPLLAKANEIQRRQRYSHHKIVQFYNDLHAMQKFNTYVTPM